MRALLGSSHGVTYMAVDVHVIILGSSYSRQLVGDLLVAESLAEPKHYLAGVS